VSSRSPEATAIVVISESATETRMMCPSDNDFELNDSIADEDYVPPSNA